MMRALIACWIFAACAVGAQVPVRWISETSRPVAQDIAVYRGETVHLQPTVTAYGAPVAWPADTSVTLWWQTNGMGSAWWSSAGWLGAVTGQICAAWSPTNDVGASAYTFFVGASSASGLAYRAAGTLTMRGSPGYLPSPAVEPNFYQSLSDALAPRVFATNDLIYMRKDSALTNGVGNLLMYDYGLSRWLRVTVSNNVWSYYTAPFMLGTPPAPVDGAAHIADAEIHLDASDRAKLAAALTAETDAAALAALNATGTLIRAAITTHVDRADLHLDAADRIKLAAALTAETDAAALAALNATGTLIRAAITTHVDRADIHLEAADRIKLAAALTAETDAAALAALNATGTLIRAAIPAIVLSNAVSQMVIYTNASGVATSWWQVASGVTNSGPFSQGAELPDGIMTNGMNSPVTLGKTYSYASDRVGIQTTADNGVDVLQVNGQSVLGSNVLVTTSPTGASTARKMYNGIPLALEVQFGGTTDAYSYPMAFFNNNTAGGNYVFTSFAINIAAATAGDVMIENAKGGIINFCNGDQKCTVGTAWAGTPVWTAKKASQNLLVGTVTDNSTDKLQVNGSVKATSIKSVYKTSNGTGAVANGTYTVGIGTTQNGTITITDGIITAIQQAQ